MIPMQSKNDIVGFARYDRFLKVSVNELALKAIETNSVEHKNDLYLVSKGIRDNVAKRNPKHKGKQIIILFEEKETPDLTVLVTSKKSKGKHFTIEGFQHGERGIKI